VRVYVVGAGAVGTYLGELLREIGNDVVYAPRELDAVEPIDAELALVTVKAYDTPGAIETLRRALRDASATTIVTPQNGVGNEELLAAAFGAENVVAAALTVPVERNASGKGVAAKGGGIAFAPVGSSSAHNWLLAAFGATALPTVAVTDYRALKWSKLALNVVANAACAILDVLPERLVHWDAIFRLEIHAIREVRATMKALGVRSIDLPRYPVRALQRVATLPSPVARPLLASRIAAARGEKPPSLLLDLRGAKHRTEVEFLNGAVARAAREAGVRAPVNTAYARIVSDIAHMPQLWAKYRERPAALLAEVGPKA
jgi:2-dehydropantoate 2-reductase